nr:MAG TPA: hypothetical protein [Caudoviricetes sp.]
MFWFNGWTVYLMKGVSNMAIKKYIGARYAPQFMGAWDKASEYAALSVVYTNDQSYVSRKTVPANTEITNTEFWIKSADWNAQVAQYNQNVEKYQANVERYNQNVETYNANVDNFFDATIHAYNTKEEMVNDTTIQANYTLITCGATAVGDGGGSLYKVASATSATAVALKNGLFAVPFDFTLESDVGQYTGVSDTTAVHIKPISTFSVTKPSNKNVNIQIPSEVNKPYVVHVYSQVDYHVNITTDSANITAISDDVDKNTDIIIIDVSTAIPSGKVINVIYGSTTGAFNVVKLTTNYADITHGTIGAFEIASDLSFVANPNADEGKIVIITNTGTDAHTISFFAKKFNGAIGQIKKDVSIPASTTYLFYVKAIISEEPVGSVPIVKYISMTNA